MDHFIYKKEDGSRDVRITTRGYLELLKDRVVSVTTDVDPETLIATLTAVLVGEERPRTFVVGPDSISGFTLASAVWKKFPAALMRATAMRLAFESWFPEVVKNAKEQILGPLV